MRVACVHTGAGVISVVTPLFRELVPEAELVNFLDDAVVKDAVAAGKVDARLTRRMCNMFLCAELSGAEAIFLTCSTVGETKDVGSRLVGIPILRIDEPMAEKAVGLGARIAVVATVASTVAPSSNLVSRKAAEAGKSVNVKAHLCEGAFDALGRGDVKLHDEMVVEAVRRLARESDVIVLAQASMLRVQPTLADLPVPVLASPRLGVERMRDLLRLG
jgi:aspartate/glutamate racemase